MSRLQNPKISNAPDRRRALENEICDVLGQKRAGNIRRNPFYELGRNLDDELIRIAFEAVFVTQ